MIEVDDKMMLREFVGNRMRGFLVCREFGMMWNGVRDGGSGRNRNRSRGEVLDRVRCLLLYGGVRGIVKEWSGWKKKKLN